MPRSVRRNDAESKARRAEYRRKYYLAHRDTEIARAVEWVTNNRTQENERKRDFYEKHKDRLRKENQERHKKFVAELDDSYVAHLLVRRVGGSTKIIPKSVVKAKRYQLLISRTTSPWRNK